MIDGYAAALEFEGRHTVICAESLDDLQLVWGFLMGKEKPLDESKVQRAKVVAKTALLSVEERRNRALYEQTLEALGKRTALRTVLNVLNHVRAHTDDAELRALLVELERLALLTSTRAEVTPLREMSACKDMTAKIDDRCNKALGRN